MPPVGYVGRDPPIEINGDEKNQIAKTSLTLADNNGIVEHGGKVIPAEKITKAGTYQLTLTAHSGTGGTYKANTSVEIKDGIIPGEYANDLEELQAGIDTAGDFHIATANLQTDPEPLSGKKLLGLNPSKVGMGNAEKSTFTLPPIDLRGVKPEELPELVFSKHANWEARVLGFQVEIDQKTKKSSTTPPR
ncbi:MAG: hypothetical protein E6700_10155 [Winkia neuii]|uniref:hypothetical protein n=1 Tax=Winkia neuii TaxID=33007 RepID=UPI0003F5ED97|nr:hypothetical protein [Winkia neuii]OFJ69998.1 hypothetical protein HMPREF2851_11015 [Actinomyces sp. HMSC064C12]OFK04531.1 hypothetical protein HMPREF2835_03675 [Actinomyces sp. HMSC072A03]OFT56155.1 hypothetical protein HMPREF3152_02580 [Actinomyces sp. HMSC06A08]KWZ72015.1 hypothetical protein HMPREF3198_02107 [Winkia neuii]MDK8100694.1 hypothetical protein [Winkia neuii]